MHGITTVKRGAEGDGAVYLSVISPYLSCAAALFQLLYRGFISLGRGFIPLLTHR
jgi:hypothetical protein